MPDRVDTRDKNVVHLFSGKPLHVPVQQFYRVAGLLRRHLLSERNDLIVRLRRQQNIEAERLKILIRHREKFINHERTRDSHGLFPRQQRSVIACQEPFLALPVVLLILNTLLLRCAALLFCRERCSVCSGHIVKRRDVKPLSKHFIEGRNDSLIMHDTALKADMFSLVLIADHPV